MAYKTKTQLVQDIIASIGEVEGTSVQTYAEPRVDVMLEQIFGIAFRKHWWPQYMVWYERTLDGTLGLVTSNINTILDIRDIRVIIPAGQEKAIPQLPPFKNPFNITGTRPRYFESLPVTNASFANKLVQIWPKTATGDIKIHARLYPTITADTVLYLDDKLLVNGAAWLILDDEDINPNAATNRERLFNEIFANIMKDYGELPIEYSACPNDSYMTNWQI